MGAHPATWPNHEIVSMPLANATRSCPECEQELIAFAQHEAKESGLEGLPGIIHEETVREAGLMKWRCHSERRWLRAKRKAIAVEESLPNHRLQCEDFA